MAGASSTLQDSGIEDSLNGEHVKAQGFANIAKDQPIDNLELFQRERDLLDLWDRLNDLKLELEILEAQEGLSNENVPISDEDLDAELEKAEKECLDARTEYLLRKSIVEDTIIGGPILNAIHAGEAASPNEQILKPLLDRRDALEIASTNLATLHQSEISKIRTLKLQTAPLHDKNKALAAEARSLARKIADRKNVMLEDPQLKGKADAARANTDTAVKQWRTMKTVVAAIVVASGVDWAEDDELRGLVLDTEDEDG